MKYVTYVLAVKKVKQQKILNILDIKLYIGYTRQVAKRSRIRSHLTAELSKVDKFYSNIVLLPVLELMTDFIIRLFLFGFYAQGDFDRQATCGAKYSKMEFSY